MRRNSNNMQNLAFKVELWRRTNFLTKPIRKFLELIQQKISEVQSRCTNFRKTVEYLFAWIKRQKQWCVEEFILLVWEIKNLNVYRRIKIYITAVSEKNESTLHLAVRYSDPTIIEKLLDAGADPNVQDSTGRTPLHLALIIGAKEVFEVLLRNPSTNLNVRMDGDITPIFLATVWTLVNDDSRLEALIKAGADLNPKDTTGMTALHILAGSIKTSGVKLLLAGGADVNVRDSEGLTPLHTAVEARMPRNFRALLRQPSVDLNAQTYDGMTPLMFAMRVKMDVMVEGLVRAGADVNMTDNSGKTALHWAAISNFVDAIDELLMNGANRTARDNKGDTPLHLAARHSSANVAKRLLNVGVDANPRNKDGLTPLHLSVNAKKLGAFEVLLRHDATDLNARTRGGLTPIMFASLYGVKGAVGPLIDAGARIDKTCHRGRTALHWAAIGDNGDAVDALLARRAKKDALDGKGRTPLFLAALEGSVEACRHLLNGGARKDIGDPKDVLPRDLAWDLLMATTSAAMIFKYKDVVRLMDSHAASRW